jgi:hypothetical protein
MTTTTTEIPREEWGFFCNAFSRQHKGWPAIVEVLGLDLGAQVEVEALPFEGITADTIDDESAISLMLGDATGDHVTHTVADPIRVALVRRESDDRPFEVLEVEDRGGTKTLLRFEAQVVPEMLDDIV